MTIEPEQIDREVATFAAELDATVLVDRETLEAEADRVLGRLLAAKTPALAALTIRAAAEQHGHSPAILTAVLTDSIAKYALHIAVGVPVDQIPEWLELLHVVALACRRAGVQIRIEAV